MKLDEAFADQFLIEGISPVVFHATALGSFLEILKQNRFKLSPAFFNSTEASFGKQFYFLSTARSRVGGYALGESRGTKVMIRLDGRKLAQRHAGSPVDFFSNMGFEGPQYDEMEDRVYSDDPFIDNALSYITGVDIFHHEDTLTTPRRVFEVYRVMKKARVPVRVYTKHQDWIIGSTNNLTHEEILDEFEANNTQGLETRSPRGRETHRWMPVILKILRTSDLKELTRREQMLLKELQREEIALTETIIKDWLRYSPSMEFARELNRLMRQHGHTTLRETIKYIMRFR